MGKGVPGKALQGPAQLYGGYEGVSPGGLICIFLLVNEVEGPSVCLPAIHMSSLAKDLFKSLKNKLFNLEEF